LYIKKLKSLIHDNFNYLFCFLNIETTISPNDFSFTTKEKKPIKLILIFKKKKNKIPSLAGANQPSTILIKYVYT